MKSCRNMFSRELDLAYNKSEEATNEVIRLKNMNYWEGVDMMRFLVQIVDQCKETVMWHELTPQCHSKMKQCAATTVAQVIFFQIKKKVDKIALKSEGWTGICTCKSTKTYPIIADNQELCNASCKNGSIPNCDENRTGNNIGVDLDTNDGYSIESVDCEGVKYLILKIFIEKGRIFRQKTSLS